MTNQDLTSQQCVPCKEGGQPLTPDQIPPLADQIAPEWQVVENHHLERTFTCDDFLDAVELLSAIAQIAEADGHHPNVHLHDYKQLTVTWYTHKIDGLHRNDFIMAAKTDTVWADHTKNE